MDIIKLLLLTLEKGLELLNTKEAKKDLEELRDLKMRFYEEKSKPQPNMAMLDYVEHRIFVLSSAFTAAPAGGSPPSPAA